MNSFYARYMKKNKNKNNNEIKNTIVINHLFNSNISKILDELGKTSKNTFNHYLFCYKFYLLYKDKVYEEVLLYTIKIKKYGCNDINNLIKKIFNDYYTIYQSDYKKYISNNTILFNYIKKLNIEINHINFIKIYNLLII
jgi:hypothetical protein